MTDGKLNPEYEVHCAGCSKAALGLGRTHAAAVKELITYGWKKVRGLWRCGECQQ